MGQRCLVAILVILTLLTGCRIARKHMAFRSVEALPPPAPVGEYHLPGFNWNDVGRVVVLPVYNASPYTRAGEEVRRALAAELQRVGRFEVVTPPPDYPANHSESIHLLGRFDELEMFEIGRFFNADIVIHTSITHYTPYPQPRLGLVIQAVSPPEAKVAAGVDGLWDAMFAETAARIRAYFRTGESCRFPVIAKALAPSQVEPMEELALTSPMLFQRFVCFEAVQILMGGTRQGQIMPPAEPIPMRPRLPEPIPEPTLSKQTSTLSIRENRQLRQKR